MTLRAFRNLVLASSLLTTVLLGTGNVSAAPVVDMYSAKYYRSGSDRGEIVTLNQGNPSVSTSVGTPAIGAQGITGLDFDNSGSLWGTTLGAPGVYGETFGPVSSLVQIDPDTGALINDIGPIHTNASDVSGSSISIGDLAYDKTTGTLYGIESNDHFINVGGGIYTIDLGTGLATFVGATIWGTAVGIAFDDAGTLYALGWDPYVGPYGTNMLFTLDKTDASELSRVTVSQNDYIFSGLGINPLTNEIYAIEDDQFSSGNAIYVVDPLTGLMTYAGTPSGVASDIAFRVTQPIPAPSALALFALAVVSLGVARRRRAG